MNLIYIHENKTISSMEKFYRYTNCVKFPSCIGIVPFSWL